MSVNILVDCRLTLDQYIDWESVDSQWTLGRHLVDSWSVFGWYSDRLSVDIAQTQLTDSRSIYQSSVCRQSTDISTDIHVAIETTHSKHDPNILFTNLVWWFSHFNLGNVYLTSFLSCFTSSTSSSSNKATRSPVKKQIIKQ